VLDKDKVLLSEWNLSEDNPNIIVVDKSGKVIYFFNEKIEKDSENELLKTIENEIKKEEF
jgi:predicted transcriptional regulator